MQWKYNDGGREAAGERFKLLKTGGDCATRSIAIFAMIPYKDLWFEMTRRKMIFLGMECNGDRSMKRALKEDAKKSMPHQVSARIIKEMGFETINCVGKKVYLQNFANMKGRYLIWIRGHLTVVIDGVINDTFDCSSYRNKERMKVIEYYF